MNPSTKPLLPGRQSETPADLTPVPAAWWRSVLFSHTMLAGLLLLLAVGLAYQPVAQAGFVWDDDTLLTSNPAIVGSLGLREVWTTRAADICPLTITTLWAEHKVWGLAPLPFHLFNVFLHAVCALLLWRVLLCLGVPGAWLGAALWALHPVQVESVAWISEMKNTQSGVFYLLAILCFLHARGRGWLLAAMVLCAALAMASKSSAMVLPAVLCLLACWRDGRWRGRVLLEVSPVFALSLAAGGLSLWTQTFAPDVGPMEVRSWPQRWAVVGDAAWFYLGKLAWPHPLMIAYPRWAITTGQWGSFVPLAALLVVLVVVLGRWRQRRAGMSAILLTAAYFLAVLFPMLGLVDLAYFHHSFVSDHFQYLASMGPLALAGAGMIGLTRRAFPGRTLLPAATGAALLLMLGLVTRQQIGVYRNQQTLWTDTLAKNPHCWVAYDLLATDFRHHGQVDRAIAEYQEGLKNNPGSAQLHCNFGVALLNLGRRDEALAQFQWALQLNDRFASAHNNLGAALLRQGRLNDATTELERALQLNGQYASAHSNLADALMKAGRFDEAILQCRAALRLNEHLASAHNNLGNALAQTGQVDEAIVQYQAGLRDEPTDARTRHNFGAVLASQGRYEEAVVQLQEAVRLNPNYRQAQEDLAAVQAAAVRQRASAR